MDDARETCQDPPPNNTKASRNKHPNTQSLGSRVVSCNPPIYYIKNDGFVSRKKGPPRYAAKQIHTSISRRNPSRPFGLGECHAFALLRRTLSFCCSLAVRQWSPWDVHHHHHNNKLPPQQHQQRRNNGADEPVSRGECRQGGAALQKDLTVADAISSILSNATELIRTML